MRRAVLMVQGKETQRQLAQLLGRNYQWSADDRELNFGYSRLPVSLLTCSNVFMTFASYGHLKFKNSPLRLVNLASWGIAFFEYMLQVPANRSGNSVYSATELKIIQEFITLCVFSGFALLYLTERIRWNRVAALVCILAAVACTFLPKTN